MIHIILSFKKSGQQLLRHSFCSRILHSCLSSKLYDGERTLRDINTAWAQEMGSLYHDGFQVGVNVYVCVLIDNIPSMYMPYIAIHTRMYLSNPGRWMEKLSKWSGSLQRGIGPTYAKYPSCTIWLFSDCLFKICTAHPAKMCWSQAWSLSTGFTSLRICHLCSGEERANHGWVGKVARTI